MPQQDPNPLDYRPPGGGGASPHLFPMGLAIGTFISAISWRMAFHSGGGITLALGLGLPAAKILAGLVLVFIPGKRMLGAGLLASIAVGVLIFFGNCAVNFKL